ncbi:MAG: hypothetical protein A3G87_04005 [Omnitrophica bacterium RIFCSPLOWO2_12_FULL_50_11]|nr:MAG: hypothetical protein A3G87_04005 [Omnitrophica bacterium RIFCSPLOWO2_12_FULL_50_11]
MSIYAEISHSLLEQLRTKKDPKLLARKLNIGMALRQIRDLEKIPLRDVLAKTGIKRSALNAIVHEKECNTAYDKLVQITKALKVGLDEFIAVARETASYNFFVLRRNTAPRFKFGRTHEVTVFSPPIFNTRDFLLAFVRILPGKKITDCLHPNTKEVCCFLVSGHLKLSYGHEESRLYGNQAVFFDGRVFHEFTNEESDSTTDFFLLYHLNPEVAPRPQRGRPATPAPFDTARLVETIRREISPDPSDPVSCHTLSQLSGVDYNSIAYLVYRKPKILFLEKIDSLCALSPLPFERMLQKAENRYSGWLKIHTDQDKTILDYRFQHGMRIHTHTALGTGLRSFGIADLYFEPVEDARRRLEWRFTDSSFMGLKVEKGVLGIQYGKQPVEKLLWGDTVYLNADIPVSFFNALTVEEAAKENQSAEVKVTAFSHPPLF